MADLKHVGRLTTTGRKVLVAFRTLPGDAFSALVIDTASLPDEQHNTLIQLVESPAAQNAFELHEVLARAKFPDGSTMLPALHVQGKLLKVPTSAVEMTPNFQARVNLAELNQIIAEQRGVSVSDLAIQNPNQKPSNVEVQEVAQVRDISPAAKTTSQSVTEDVQPVAAPAVPDMSTMSPEQQAKHFRSEADKLSKLAAEMRRQAEAILPATKKKSSKESVSG
jgi:hypothetical protein